MSEQAPNRALHTMVVGGYGCLGSRVTRGLVKELGHHVIVAGRDRDRARDFADGEGLDVTDRRIDLDRPKSFSGALDQVDLIINCADQSEAPHLAGAAVEGGLPYIDLTHDYEMLARILDMDDRAKETGARLMVGGGLSPGLVNLLARSAVEAVEQPEALHSFTHVELGPNTSETRMRQLSNITRKFPIMEGQYDGATTNHAESCVISFPPPVGRREAHRFALPDQFFYPDTLGVPNCASWLSLQPKRLAKLLHGLAKTHIAPLVGQKRLNGLAGRVARELAKESNDGGWMLMVEASGKHTTRRVTATGRYGVEDTAALFAIELARLLMAGPQLEPGVWLPEEVLTVDAFFKHCGCQIAAEDLPRSDMAAAS